MEYSIYVLLIPMVMFLFLGLFQGQLKGTLGRTDRYGGIGRYRSIGVLGRI